MNGYDAAVTAWARKFLGDDRPRTYDLRSRTDGAPHPPWSELIDWSQPCLLDFNYEEPYQYSEYTGGGGTGEITVHYPLLGGGVHSKIYADLSDLNRTGALPKLIAEILSEAAS